MPSKGAVRDALDRSRRELATVFWSAPFVCATLVAVGAGMLRFAWELASVSSGYVDAESVVTYLGIALFMVGAGLWLAAHWLRFVWRVTLFRARHGRFEFSDEETAASWRLLNRIPLSDGAARRVCRLGPGKYERVVSRLVLGGLVERAQGRICRGLVQPKKVGGFVRRR